MGDYKYSDPTTRGFTKFKLTKKQHNQLFKYRQIKWVDKYEYYYNDNLIIMHKSTNWKGVWLTTLLFPLLVLLNGVVNFRELWEELVRLHNQKERGSFVSDHVYDEKYDEIMKIIHSGDNQ